MKKIKYLGEFGLIDHLSRNFKHHLSNTILPIGDDCAAYSASPSKDQLVSTDALVENIHFKLSTITAEQLGKKSIAVNISDIAAMGGTPTRILITLGISKKISASFLDQLYKGIHKTCELYNIELFGGDTVSSPNCFFINVTIIGETKKGKLFTRKGAKIGDLIFTTGTLGDSSLGLKMQSGKKWKCSAKSKKYLLEQHLIPTPRLKESQLLARSTCKINSMIDVSDGLVQDLHHICTQSGKGALIYEEKLPQSPAFSKVCSDNNLNPAPFILNGGEDYELLFTLPDEDVKKLENITLKVGVPVTKIGRMTSGKGVIRLLKENESPQIRKTTSGFDHFR